MKITKLIDKHISSSARIAHTIPAIKPGMAAVDPLLLLPASICIVDLYGGLVSFSIRHSLTPSRVPGTLQPNFAAILKE